LGTKTNKTPFDSQAFATLMIYRSAELFVNAIYIARQSGNSYSSDTLLPKEKTQNTLF
jgi:hypothetical protein